MSIKKQIKEAYQKNTSKASDISRQLAFAGLAIIWIFKEEKTFKIPDDLINPSIILSVFLLCDLIQYFFLGSAWWWVFRKSKKHKIRWIPNISVCIFFGKFLLLLIAYIMIICYLYTKVV